MGGAFVGGIRVGGGWVGGEKVGRGGGGDVGDGGGGPDVGNVFNDRISMAEILAFSTTDVRVIVNTPSVTVQYEVFVSAR